MTFVQTRVPPFMITWLYNFKLPTSRRSRCRLLLDLPFTHTHTEKIKNKMREREKKSQSRVLLVPLKRGRKGPQRLMPLAMAV